jgi:hypothetical protein
MLAYSITKAIIRSSVGASGQQAQWEHGSITSKLSARGMFGGQKQSGPAASTAAARF